MRTEANKDDYQFYEIRIEGHLNDTRLSEFGELFVTTLPEGQTLISGPIADQAQLFGILIRIRDMGVPLLSVNTRQSKFRQAQEDVK